MMKRFLSYPNSRTRGNTRLGFTLIEIMIAISILAILATIGMTTYNQAQMRGRDVKRKQDLRSIATALELYYQRHKHFPCTDINVNQGWQNSTSTAGALWLTNAATVSTACGGTAGTHPFNNNFINIMPNDPSGNTVNMSASYGANGTNLGYSYWAQDNMCSLAAGQFYILVAHLENNNDPDSLGRKAVGGCAGATISNTTRYGNNAFILTSQ